MVIFKRGGTSVDQNHGKLSSIYFNLASKLLEIVIPAPFSNCSHLFSLRKQLKSIMHSKFLSNSDKNATIFVIPRNDSG